jgi:hypothetical protein
VVNRQVKQLLLDVVKLDDVLGHEDDAPALEDMARRAKKMLDDDSGARRRKLKKTLPTRKAKAEQALANLEAHRRLRERAFLRADGRCELCGVPFKVNEQVHLHHLEGGPGKAKREQLCNVMAVHSTCHEAYHMSVASFVEAVRGWCQRHGYPLPKRKEFRR